MKRFVKQFRHAAVHRKLACILDGLAVDKVLPEGLLHQHIAAVFFILQDAADAGDGPLRGILGALDALLFQFPFDHPQAGSGEIAFRRFQLVPE